MGIVTDFFLASTSDLARFLNGWQLPPPMLQNPGSYRKERLAASAHSKQAPLLAWSQPPKPNPDANPSPQIGSLPNVQCKGLLPDKLALLYASLAEIPTEHALDLIMLGFLTGPPEAEVTVQQLPPALTNALAIALDVDLIRAAQIIEDDDIDRWGNSFRGTAKELTRVLSRVQTLAQKGLTSDADLFIWTCT